MSTAPNRAAFVAAIMLGCVGDGSLGETLERRPETPASRRASPAVGAGTRGGPPPAAASVEIAPSRTPAPGTADVVAVKVRGAPGDYRVTVTVRSPDTGCEGFADWWELVSTDGVLRHRRILRHSHVSEQPFSRDGGPIDVPPDEILWARAHFSAGGYGRAFTGSLGGDWAPAEPPEGLGPGVEGAAPQPGRCLF